MIEAPLLTNIMLLGTGIETCLERRLLIPALILIYSGIDVLGWLASGEKDASKWTFINWANAYLLRESPLKCTTLDLWAARCALLHTMTARAKPKPKEKARQICYAFDSMQAQRVQRSIDLSNTGDRFVAVHINDLWDSWRIGVMRFLDEAAKDPEMMSRALGKAANFYTSIKPEEVEMAIARLEKNS